MDMTTPDLPPATNESFEIKRIETVAAACCAAFMHQLGARVEWYAHAWEPDMYSKFLQSGRWRRDNQVIDFHHDPHDHRKSEYVQFMTPFYGPQSDFVEGTAKLLQDVELKVDGLTKVFDNSKGRDPLQIAYTENVDIENSVTTSVKNAFTFDVTVGSETTVSGEYAGASLEQKLSTEVHTGFSKEEGRDEAESKSSSTGVGVEFTCPAGAIKLVNIVKKHQRELIPVQGLFVVDFGMEMKLRHWWADRIGTQYRVKSQDYFQVDSAEGLYQLAKGVDTDYPDLSGFWDNAHACTPRVRAGILHLLDPTNRTYYLDADKMRVIESSANYKVADLDAPAYDGATVVDLDDEENRAKYTNG